MTLHRDLTGADLHEPKGIATAAKDTVYVATGTGTGEWKAVTGGSGGTVSGSYQAAGGVTRTVVDKLGDWVSVKDFKTTLGVTDDVAALNAAFASLGSGGGTVIVPANVKILIDTNLTIPVNCQLVAPFAAPGNPGDNTSTPYAAMRGTIILNPSASIYLSSSSGIDGLMIYRKGVTFNESDASAFAGTALRAIGEDVTVRDCLILGFGTALYSSNCQRLRAYGILFDCLTGIEMNACYDVARIENCHGWPFLTIAKFKAGAPASSLHRSGHGIFLHDVNDDGMVTDCFTYGYYRGFRATNTVGVVFLNCGADNTAAFVGSNGFVLDGTTRDTTIQTCKATGNETGFYVNTVLYYNRLSSVDAWGNTKEGVQLAGGATTIEGGNLRDSPYAITVGTGENIVIDNVRFSSISGPRIIDVTTSTGALRIGQNCEFNGQTTRVVASNADIPTVAGTDAMYLPLDGSVFNISGSANIGTIFGGWPGRIVTLRCLAAPKFFNGGSLFLQGATDYQAAAGAILTLCGIGGDATYDKWVEIGRVTGTGGTGGGGAGKPVITSSTTASGAVGQAFTYQITATNSPTSYAATGLPSGLSVNTTTGAITGTPTAVATTSVTLTATNASGTSTAVTLTITIAASATKPVVNSASTSSATQGSAWTYQITATNSPTSYSATSLPSWASINTATGLISGTPTTSGTFTFSVNAANAAGSGVTPLTVTLTVAAAAAVNITLTDGMTLPAGTNFNAAGDPPVGTLFKGSASSTITLTFSGYPTIFHSTGSGGYALSDATTWNATPGSTLTLSWNGTYWNEVSRSYVPATPYTQAAADGMTLVQPYHEYNLTGSANIGAMFGGGFVGRQVKLNVSGGTITFYNGGSFNLAGGVDWVATSGHSIILQYMGTSGPYQVWNEIFRS